MVVFCQQLAKMSQEVLRAVSCTQAHVTAKVPILQGGRRAHDRIVVGFTISYAISAYHHCCCEFESRSGRGVQHYMIKFVSDFRQVSSFLWVLRFPPLRKLTATI